MDRDPANGRFLKGNNANPGGRPQGFAAHVRAETRDGKELVELFLHYMRDVSQKAELRLDAAQWLADRGWGKAVQMIQGDPDAPLVQIYLPERGPIV